MADARDLLMHFRPRSYALVATESKIIYVKHEKLFTFAEQADPQTSSSDNYNQCITKRKYLRYSIAAILQTAKTYETRSKPEPFQWYRL